MPNLGAYTALNYFFWALGIAAFVVEAWAFVDAISRPRASFVAAGKQTKQIWLLILGVACVFGLAAAVRYGGQSFTSIFVVIAFVAAAIYLVDVRPKVREFKRGRSTHNGPYGPW